MSAARVLACLLLIAGTLPARDLTPDKEILAATFVDLDMAAFPVLPPAAPPEKGTVHVAPGGNDRTGDGSERAPFRTIARGLHAVGEGGTVLVRAGTYREVWEEDDYRGLVMDKKGVALTAVPGETVTVMPASRDVKTGLDLAASDCLVRGIRLEGFITVGVLLSGERKRTNIRLVDLKVSGASEGIASWEGTVEGLLAADVQISGASEVGFHCGTGTARSWRLERVTIAMKAGGGGSGADAFAVEHGDNILLVDVETSGASADGIDTKATRVVLLGCRVHHVERNGIKLWHGGDVINCLVHHTGADAAVVIEEGPRTRLVHSLVAYHNYGAGQSYNMTFGYDSQARMNAEIINCVIFNTSGGAYFNPNVTLRIEHSLFGGMENGQILEHGRTQVELAHGAAGLAAFGSGNRVGDPRLDREFRAPTGGPTVNAGKALPADYPARDLSGHARVQGARPDLGPYELTP